MLIRLLNKHELLQIKETIDRETDELGDFKSGIYVNLKNGFLYVNNIVDQLTIHEEDNFYSDLICNLNLKQSQLLIDYFVEKLRKKTYKSVK